MGENNTWANISLYMYIVYMTVRNYLSRTDHQVSPTKQCGESSYFAPLPFELLLQRVCSQPTDEK